MPRALAYASPNGARTHEVRTSRAVQPGGSFLASVRATSLEVWLFYIAFVLCSFTTLMVRTTYLNVFGMPKELFEPLGYALSALLLIAKLVLDREVSWRYALAWALVLVAAVSFLVAGAWRVSVLFLFIAAGKGVQLKHLAALALLVQTAVLAVTLPLAFSGRLYSFTVWREVAGEWLPRYSYGYSHPNFLGQIFLTMALSFAVLRFPRFHVGDIVVYASLAAAAGMLVWARTATACIVLVGILAAASPFIVRTPSRQRVATLLALCMFVALAVFSYAFMIAYNPEVAWMHSLDQALSMRFSLAHRFFEVFPPQPFGRSVMAVKLGDFAQESPDNAYVYMLIKQGIIPTLILGALVLTAYVCAVREGKWSAGIVGLAVFAVGGVMEYYAVNFTLDFFLIMCAAALYATNAEGGAQDAVTMLPAGSAQDAGGAHGN